jgi:hypothetical protein
MAHPDMRRQDLVLVLVLEEVAMDLALVLVLEEVAMVLVWAGWRKSSHNGSRSKGCHRHMLLVQLLQHKRRSHSMASARITLTFR